MKKQQGFIGIIIVLVITGLFVGAIWLLICLRIEPSEQVVSGIAYNVTNDSFISGNTNFGIRASVDTYTTEANQSTYCLPPNSPYIALVNEAAKDKSIKLVVTTKKVFTVVSAPWLCVNNVTVVKG